MSASIDAERVIKSSIMLSNRLITNIEADLRDVHEMIHCNERDYEDKEKMYHAMRQENIAVRQHALLLQQELDQDRVERRNDQFRHAMELEEQRQSYEGEIVRILSMYKLAEENKSFASTQAVAATDRVQELEDKLHSVEADREQLRTALRAVTEENDELRGDLHRNESFYAVMETSYTETVQRCKMLQAALDSFEARHKDEVRQVELQCFRLKERNRYLERRQAFSPSGASPTAAAPDDMKDIVEEYNRISASGLFGDERLDSVGESSAVSRRVSMRTDYRSTLAGGRAAVQGKITGFDGAKQDTSPDLPNPSEVIASRDEPVGENNAPEEYAFDLIALAAVSDYDSLPSSGGSRLDVSTSNLAKPASWRRAPPKPPGRA